MVEPKFDIDRFNRDFDQYKDKRKLIMKQQMDQKLAELNKPVVKPPIYELPVGEMFIRVTDSIFGIVDDLLNFNLDLNLKSLLTKDDRTFSLGLTVLIIGLTLVIYHIFTVEDRVNNDIRVFIENK